MARRVCRPLPASAAPASNPCARGQLPLDLHPGHCLTLLASSGWALLQMDLYPEVPDNVPLYNLREVVPEIYEPR